MISLSQMSQLGFQMECPAEEKEVKFNVFLCHQ